VKGTEYANYDAVGSGIETSSDGGGQPVKNGRESGCRGVCQLKVVLEEKGTVGGLMMTTGEHPKRE
jgi:hypothetical protein